MQQAQLIPSWALIITSIRQMPTVVNEIHLRKFLLISLINEIIIGFNENIVDRFRFNEYNYDEKLIEEAMQ